jgi:ParB family chromosome partitioning protein
VFEQIGPHTPAYAIRRAMTEAKVRADDRRVRFVGVETYEAAGGPVLRDLFTEDGGSWLEDVALLDRLVAEKLTGLADEARDREGWKWAGVSTDYADVSDFGRVYPVAVERTETDAAEIAALSEEYDGIVAGAGVDGLSPSQSRMLSRRPAGRNRRVCNRSPDAKRRVARAPKTLRCETADPLSGGEGLMVIRRVKVAA